MNKRGFDCAPTSSIKCPRENYSNTLMWTRRTSSDVYEWRCSRRNCNGMTSMRQNSWFSGSRLSIEKVLALTYAWAHKVTTTQAVHETSLDDESTSTETVMDWYDYWREVLCPQNDSSCEANRQTRYDC